MSALPSSLPASHGAFIKRVIEECSKDPRIVGVAVAGSYTANTMDEYSDLDFVIAVEPDQHESILRDRRELAARMGVLINSFTGEHVGESRLLVCLYAHPLLHVDFKFVKLPDAVPVVDTPAVLWERDNRLSTVLAGKIGSYPKADPQWLEDRFWMWVHYLACKIGRGEYFEAMEGLSFLRIMVLAPLVLSGRGLSNSGMRRLEAKAPDVAANLRKTVAEPTRESLLTALSAAIAYYRRLRREYSGAIEFRREAEEMVERFLETV